MLRALVLTALAAVVSVWTAAAQAEPSRIEAYADDLVWSCPPANPSCTRDHWSIEHNELQDDTRVTYAAIGARFTTERRFAEAVNVVWQWPEGKTLLRQANDSGVLMISLDYDRQTSFATYSPQRELIAINRRYVAAPTWMLAGVVAHELTHASADALAAARRPASATALDGAPLDRARRTGAQSLRAGTHGHVARPGPGHVRRDVLDADRVARCGWGAVEQDALMQIERDRVHGASARAMKGALADVVALHDLFVRTPLHVGFVQDQIVQPATGAAAAPRVGPRTTWPQALDRLDQVAPQQRRPLNRGPLHQVARRRTAQQRVLRQRGQVVQVPQRALDQHSQIGRWR